MLLILLLLLWVLVLRGLLLMLGILPVLPPLLDIRKQVSLEEPEALLERLLVHLHLYAALVGSFSRPILPGADQSRPINVVQKPSLPGPTLNAINARQARTVEGHLSLGHYTQDERVVSHGRSSSASCASEATSVPAALGRECARTSFRLRSMRTVCSWTDLWGARLTTRVASDHPNQLYRMRLVVFAFLV